MYHTILSIDEAVNAFIEDLKASPESAADLAQTLISRLQDGSSVSKPAAYHNVGRHYNYRDGTDARIMQYISPSLYIIFDPIHVIILTI